MNLQNFEDWLIGAASAVAVGAVFGAHLLSMPIASEAIASEAAPTYTITVTAKRLPAHCKSDAAAAGCAQQITETMRANN